MADRAVPGHWEGDLIVGAAHRSAIGRLPEQLARPVTWDQGTEVSRHLDFTVDTGVQVYFCDPHSPWQRPSNENRDGRLRQFFPKGTDFSVHGRVDLDEAERKAQRTAPQTLDWRKPSKRVTELIALTG